MGSGTDDDDATRLYRAVSQEELDDIISIDGFRPGIGQLETKLFTTSAEDAAFFAREVLYPGSSHAEPIELTIFSRI